MDYNNKYLKYKAKYLKLKSLEQKQVKIMNGGGNSPTINVIYLFKADWCGHCKAFKSVWESLQENLKDKINFVTYDNEKNSDEIKKFGVEGFPTIILKNNNKAIEYVGPRDEQSLIEFINMYN